MWRTCESLILTIAATDSWCEKKHSGLTSRARCELAASLEVHGPCRDAGLTRGQGLLGHRGADVLPGSRRLPVCFCAGAIAQPSQVVPSGLVSNCLISVVLAGPQNKSLARELRTKQKWTDRQFAMMCVQHGTWLPCCRLPRLTHKLATMELYDMMRLKLTETRVPTPLPFFTTRFPPLSVSLIAFPPLSLQHVVASSHLARGISCSLWWISQTSSSCSWSCPGKSVFWNRRIGHDLNQHAGRPLHVWTLYMTTAGIGVTSTRWAPSRRGIRCLFGAARPLEPDVPVFRRRGDIPVLRRRGDGPGFSGRWPGWPVLLARLVSVAPVLLRIVCRITVRKRDETRWRPWATPVASTFDFMTQSMSHDVCCICWW